MKKIVISCILLIVFKMSAFSQTWTEYGDDNFDVKRTIITKEQFDRIVTANETGALAVTISYID